jgi:hypothetical protein
MPDLPPILKRFNLKIRQHPGTGLFLMFRQGRWLRPCCHGRIHPGGTTVAPPEETKAKRTTAKLHSLASAERLSN